MTDIVEVMDKTLVAQHGIEHYSSFPVTAKEMTAHFERFLAEAGMAIVPIEPTEAMIAAGEKENFAGDDDFYDFASGNVWKAMLDAAKEAHHE